MTKYLTCAETAKLIRADLKKVFPGVKFSVTSDVYSGGATVRIRYRNGPTSQSVEDVVKIYECKGFDGMIDYAYYKTVWMMPDGTLSRAYREDTETCNGTVPGCNNPKPHADAIEVSMGASYVCVTREIDEDIKLEIGHRIAKEYGADWNGERAYDFQVPAACEYLSTLVHRELSKTAL